MKEITLKSGHVLSLGLADFEDGVALFQTIVNELKESNIDLGGVDLKQMTQVSDMDLSVMLKPILQILGSKAVLAGFYACAKRSMLDTLQITPASFKRPEFRGDFLPCAWEVMKFTLAPFFENLDLSSLISTPPKEAVQP